MGNNVNHPGHYNAPGRKECIVEMLEKFGSEKVQTFCELNAYKYQYRHEMKNGQEDLDKAAWYEEYESYLRMNDDRYKIADHFGFEGQSKQLIEEMAELTQAICKYFRSKGQGQPIPAYKISMVKQNIIEEIADVKLVLEQIIYLMNVEDEVQEIMNEKIERTIGRMGENNAGN